MESAASSTRFGAGEGVARISPTLTAASGGGGVLGNSRPSTQATVRDGILIRWNDDSNPMLRRPRTGSATSDQASRRSSAKLSKSRFNVVLKKQKVTGLVAKTMAAATKSQPPEKTASELCYEASQDTKQPLREAKQNVLKQYHLETGIVLNKMELPSIPPAEMPKSKIGDPYAANDRAVRQLTNSCPTRLSLNYLQPTPVATSHRPNNVYNRAKLTGKHGYCRVGTKRQSRSLNEYEKMIEIRNLAKEENTDSQSDEASTTSRPVSAMSVRTFCKKLRPQTAVAAHQTSEHMLQRPKSCMPRFRISETPHSGDSTVEGTKARAEEGCSVPTNVPTESTKVKQAALYRSCWLSPLEKCNVPPDQKLRYIANSEKKRHAKIMFETSRLLRNESRNPMIDKLLEQRRRYKPDLGNDTTDSADDNEQVEDPNSRQNIHIRLSQLLESCKDDAMLQKLTTSISNSTFKRRQSEYADEMNYYASTHQEDDSCDTKVDPTLPLACDTSRAMIAGFYHMMREHNSHHNIVRA